MSSTARKLEILLLSEQAVLRRGALGELARIAEEKTRLIEDLAARPMTRPEALVLKGLAAGNARALAAALKGVRAAKARIDMARRSGRTLDLYDGLGRSRRVETGPAAVLKRT